MGFVTLATLPRAKGHVFRHRVYFGLNLNGLGEGQPVEFMNAVINFWVLLDKVFLGCLNN